MRGPLAGRTWKIVVSAALAIALLLVFLRQTPLSEITAELHRIDPRLLAASIIAALLGYFLRALRWGLIVRPLGRARISALWGATAAGFAASTVLPARAGEVVRPALLASQAKLPFAGCLASILTERLADLATVLAVFAFGVTLASDHIAPDWLPSLHAAAALAFAALVVAFSAALILLRHRDRAVAAIVRISPTRFAPAAGRFVDHLFDGIAVIRSPLRLAELGAWSAVLWLTIAVQALLLARAFGLPLDLGDIAVMIAVSILGLAIPTPGGVGGFHAAVQFALHRILGVDLPAATAFALVHHAVCFVPITIIGLVHLGLWGLSLGAARHLAETGEPGSAGEE